jgi:hypothetical protein
MAFVPLMLIVNRARAAAGNCSDRSAGSATRNSANGRAASRTNRYSLDGSANPMPPVRAMINHISDHRSMS